MVRTWNTETVLHNRKGSVSATVRTMSEYLGLHLNMMGVRAAVLFIENFDIRKMLTWCLPTGMVRFPTYRCYFVCALSFHCHSGRACFCTNVRFILFVDGVLRQGTGRSGCRCSSSSGPSTACQPWLCPECVSLCCPNCHLAPTKIIQFPKWAESCCPRAGTFETSSWRIGLHWFRGLLHLQLKLLREG